MPCEQVPALFELFVSLSLLLQEFLSDEFAQFRRFPWRGLLHLKPELLLQLLQCLPVDQVLLGWGHLGSKGYCEGLEAPLKAELALQASRLSDGDRAML